MAIRPGPRNLITDVDGIAVGNAQSLSVQSGVTVVLPDKRSVAGCDVRGGAPGTRETDALNLTCLVDAVEGLVLSGGSVYGLEAMSGAVAWLGVRKRGFALGETPVVSPVVPGAVLFDLPNGGDKNWGEMPPYREWGREACASVSRDFELGNAGAGTGAMAGNIKGGLGSASALDGDLLQVGALIAVNPFGSVVMPETGHFWAAPYELDGEFGGRGWPATLPTASADDVFRGTRLDIGSTAPGANTTIGIVATNAALTKAEATRIAIMAQDGLARSIRPIHSQVDGDTIFCLATGTYALPDDPLDRLMQLMRIGAIAADTVARAVARGVYAAADLGNAVSYKSKYPLRQA